MNYTMVFYMKTSFLASLLVSMVCHAVELNLRNWPGSAFNLVLFRIILARNK